MTGPLAERGFRLFLVGRFLAMLGFQVQSVAVGWQIYDLVRSPAALGYVGLAQFVPFFLLALPSGTLADQFDRRHLLAIAYGGAAACSGLLLILTALHVSQSWPFYAVLALFGASRALSGPSMQSLVPLLVSKPELPRALAISSSAFQTAVIIGPAIGGALYLAGPAATYALCMATYVAVSASLGQVQARPQEKAPGALGPLDRIKAGIAYVRANRTILGAISLDLFAVLLGGATALLPVFARDILAIGPVGLGMLRSAPAVGAASVALILARHPLDRWAGLVMFGCVALFGISTIVFGLSTSVPLSLAALVTLGASDMISVYIRSTLVQLRTPDAMRGRVSAVNLLFIGASNELGEFESGITASWLGTVPSVVIGGLGTLGVVALWAWAFPELRRADRLSGEAPPDALDASPPLAPSSANQ